MLIRVLYHDGHYGAVDDTRLDRLISDGNIRQFRRTHGWVTIGDDPIRMHRFDRRRPGQLLNIYV